MRGSQADVPTYPIAMVSTSRPSWLRPRSMYRRALLGLLRLVGALLCNRLVDGPDTRVSLSLDGSELDAVGERAAPDLLKPDSDFSILRYATSVTSQQDACCRLAASLTSWETDYMDLSTGQPAAWFTSHPV